MPIDLLSIVSIWPMDHTRYKNNILIILSMEEHHNDLIDHLNVFSANLIYHIIIISQLNNITN
jgi:hypothetical protein